MFKVQRLDVVAVHLLARILATELGNWRQWSIIESLDFVPRRYTAFVRFVVDLFRESAMPSSTPDMVAQKLEAARRGSHPAIDWLLLRSRPGLLRYIDARLPLGVRGAVSPDDIVQETWASACRGFPRFEGSTMSELERWLQTIAKRRCIDALRRETAKRDEHVQVNQLATTLKGVLLDSGDSPSRILASEEALAQVKDAVLQVNPNYRQVLQWRYLEELTPSEIALRLGKSKGAAVMMCQRALQAVREVLDSSDLDQ